MVDLIGGGSKMSKSMLVCFLLVSIPSFAQTSVEIGSRFSSDTKNRASVYVQADYRFQNDLVIQLGYNNFGDIKFNKFNDEFYLPYKTVRTAIGYHWKPTFDFWIQPSLGYEMSTTELTVDDSYEYKLLSKYQGSPSAGLELGWNFYQNLSFVFNITATAGNGDISSRTFTGAGLHWTWGAAPFYSPEPAPVLPNNRLVPIAQKSVKITENIHSTSTPNNHTASTKPNLCLQIGVFNNPENANALLLKGRKNGIALQVIKLNDGRTKVVWQGQSKIYLDTRELIKKKLTIEPIPYRCFL